jgi:hypothetical protein
MSDRRAALVRDPALFGLGGAAAVAALHFRDPHVSGSWGYCPFLLLTGLPCPGCGGLRAVNDLTNGDVVGALSSNAFAVALVAVVSACWVVWLVRRACGNASAQWLTLTMPTTTTLLVVMAVFGVFRWTPWGAWLRP